MFQLVKTFYTIKERVWVFLVVPLTEGQGAILGVSLYVCKYGFGFDISTVCIMLDTCLTVLQFSAAHGVVGFLQKFFIETEL